MKENDQDVPVTGRKCALCGHSDVRVRWRLQRRNVLRCRECGLMWADPPPDEDQLTRLYGRQYFERQTEVGKDLGVAGYDDYVGNRFLKQMDHRRVALRLACMVATSSSFAPPKLLDVGCAMGHFLDTAQDCGFDVEGVDRSSHAIDALSAKYRFPATCTDFLDFDGGPYDTVTMLDVLEHFKDPFGALRKAAKLVRAGGVLAVSNPNMDSFVARLLEKRNEIIQKADSGEHLTFFTSRTLATALNREGFDVIRTENYGLTLDLATAARRVGTALPFVGTIAGTIVKAVGLSRAFAHFNHHLIMIVYARRRNNLSPGS